MAHARTEFVHGARHQQQSLNRLSALRVRLSKQARRAENQEMKAAMLAECREEHQKDVSRIKEAFQKKDELRQARVAAHAELLANNPGAKKKENVEACRQRNFESGAEVREARAQNGEMLAQRDQYFLEQNIKMADFVRESTRAGVEKSMRQARANREELAHERKQQSKICSEHAEAIANEQKQKKAEKAARVQALRETCRDKADRITEEKRRGGSASREMRAQHEEMLQQRDDFFQELNRARHDEVKSHEDAAKELMQITSERLAETQRMKQEQFAKQAKIDEEKAALQERRREKTIAQKESMMAGAKKSVEDVREMKRSMIEKDRAQQEDFVAHTRAQQDMMCQAIKDEEQRLLDQLSSFS